MTAAGRHIRLYNSVSPSHIHAHPKLLTSALPMAAGDHASLVFAARATASSASNGILSAA